MWQFGTDKVRQPILVKIKDYLSVGPTSTSKYERDRDRDDTNVAPTYIMVLLYLRVGLTLDIIPKRASREMPSKTNASLQR